METLHPGLYVQEVPGEKTVEGVSTSTGAFVGTAERGPIGASQLVTSFNDFVRKYGSYINNSYLAYAVKGFFDNGGGRAYISRAVHYDTNGVKTSTASTVDFTWDNDADSLTSEVVYLTVDAKYDGSYGNDYEAEIANISGGKFDLVIYEDGTQVEKYEGLELLTADDVVNSESKHVVLTVVDETATLTAEKKSLAGGTDGLSNISASDYEKSLNAFDNNVVNIVAIPGITDVATHTALTTYVENRGDAFAIVEAPLGKTPTTALAYKNTEAGLNSQRVAFYYSWIKVADPIGVGKNPTKFVPPSGHLTGLYARTDNERGVFKAPAGIESVVRGAVGLEYNVNDSEQDILNPEGVNVIRAFSGEGIIVWGARTTSADPEWKYINVRRSVDFIEQSILEATRWSVFEPNDSTLWSKLTLSVSGFLRGFWQDGGLRGESEGEAFFVKCDETTTTADDIDAGKVYAHIGVSTQKPAEFIVFKVSLRK